MDAALHRSHISFNSVLERGPKKSTCIKFKIFFRHTAQFKESTDGFLKMIQTEAKSGADPHLHQQFSGPHRPAAKPEHLQRYAISQRNARIGNLHNVRKLRVRAAYLQL